MYSVIFLSPQLWNFGKTPPRDVRITATVFKHPMAVISLLHETPAWNTRPQGNQSWSCLNRYLVGNRPNAAASLQVDILWDSCSILCRRYQVQGSCIAQQAWRSSRSQILGSYMMDCGAPTVYLVPLWGHFLGKTGLVLCVPCLGNRKWASCDTSASLLVCGHSKVLQKDRKKTVIQEDSSSSGISSVGKWQVISETVICSLGCFWSLGSCSERLPPPLRLSPKVFPVLWRKYTMGKRLQTERNL